MHWLFFKWARRLGFLFLKHLHDFLAFLKGSFIVHGLFTISIISNGLYTMIKILNYSKYWIIHIWESDIHYSIWAIHELIPIEGFLPTTCPIFFQVMENRLTLMKMTSILIVIILRILFRTTLVHTLQFPTFGFE